MSRTGCFSATVGIVVIAIVISVCSFYIYTGMQTMGSQFGFSWRYALRGVGFTGCVAALLWAIAWCAWSFVRAVHFLFTADRRWRTGRCAVCGHLRSDAAAEDAPCFECGSAYVRPVHTSMQTQRQFTTAVIAIILGCATGEAWLRLDEAAFRNEVEHIHNGSGDVQRRRARWYPNGSASLWYSPDYGFSATD